jgi:mono/diheme cytochrome c family protein
MSRLFWFLVMPALAAAADGAAIYRASCGVAYCHGAEGKAGRAPALAGTALTPREIAATVAKGIPGTSMPSFAARLKTDEIEAVTAYIVGLGGGARRPAAAVTPMPAQFEPGRALFFDAARTGACGSCHEVGGRGIAVSVALADLRKTRLGDPRTIETPEVVTVQPAGETPFPAVVSEKTAATLRVYDLSSRLPVLRTLDPRQTTVTPGSSWRHSVAASLYSDAELDAIVRYLRWAAAQ